VRGAGSVKRQNFDRAERCTFKSDAEFAVDPAGGGPRRLSPFAPPRIDHTRIEGCGRESDSM
jgi:hypothetical protein